ncbi:uracil phosphoribosyltransferase [Roseivirga sp. BDSF3-8]|uniref:uracil phosphoribosyltransferase n=1 Tax=Roseivirga sp. BDSF3-8 TaxID=3241598 RepID=UPI0035318362
MTNGTFILTDTHSVASEFLAQLRDTKVQTDRSRFRRNLRRLGQILAYEISRRMPFEDTTVQTPLAKTAAVRLTESPVLVTVMRAGLPFYDGFLDYFDRSESGFIGAFREEESSDGEVSVALEYAALPDTAGRPVLLADPMLATGKSLLYAVEAINKQGKPSHLYIASAIAAPEGVNYLKDNIRQPFSLWVGAVDEKLNANAFIVPGLGDAGDLAFGPKN